MDRSTSRPTVHAAPGPTAGSQSKPSLGHSLTAAAFRGLRLLGLRAPSFALCPLPLWLSVDSGLGNMAAHFPDGSQRSSPPAVHILSGCSSDGLYGQWAMVDMMVCPFQDQVMKSLKDLGPPWWQSGRAELNDAGAIEDSLGKGSWVTLSMPDVSMILADWKVWGRIEKPTCGGNEASVIAQKTPLVLQPREHSPALDSPHRPGMGSMYYVGRFPAIGKNNSCQLSCSR
ncbi:hypothetical protein TREES_T100017038 [Tupaia chinensis]|uniref:Uncharacterized protein n=1 Tax=Tupaia chinensis TaxID=246437 RepID=L9KUC3_TUPCH|nr:hypothetical protein TREES_T100017038 [Tupaia chinensis]